MVGTEFASEVLTTDYPVFSFLFFFFPFFLYFFPFGCPFSSISRRVLSGSMRHEAWVAHRAFGKGWGEDYCMGIGGTAWHIGMAWRLAVGQYLSAYPGSFLFLCLTLSFFFLFGFRLWIWGECRPGLLSLSPGSCLCRVRATEFRNGRLGESQGAVAISVWELRARTGPDSVGKALLVFSFSLFPVSRSLGVLSSLGNRESGYRNWAACIWTHGYGSICL